MCAYKVLKGTIIPTTVPPIEEEQEVCSAPLPVVRSFPNVSPLPVRIRPKIDLENLKFETEGIMDCGTNVQEGSKVIRKIRPYDVGTIEFLYYYPTGRLREIWVKFGTKTSTPYEIGELEKIRMNA